MTMTIGNTTNSTAPNTDVSHGPRNGLRHRIRDKPGGGWFSNVRHNTAGKLCTWACPVSGSASESGSAPTWGYAVAARAPKTFHPGGGLEDVMSVLGCS